MSTNIWSVEYAQAMREKFAQEQLREPTPEEVERALFDQIEQWPTEERRWMGIDDQDTNSVGR